MATMNQNIATYNGTIHATRGKVKIWGTLYPNLICGSSRSVRHYFFGTDEPVTCKRCIVKLAAEYQRGGK